MTDQRIEKWGRWIDHGISSDVFTMHLERYAWRRLEEIVSDNAELKDTESYIWEFLFDTYTKTQAAAVRRQADTDPQAASLGRLICDIAETPELLSRDFWLGLWSERDDDAHWRQVAEDAWAKQYAGEIGDHLDPAIPEADLAELRDGSKKVRDYVDQHVAHMDARTIRSGDGPPTGAPPDAPTKTGQELPTLNEVHDAIDLVGHLFRKYANLLTAATWTDLVPALQHDWEAVFREPWIRSENLGS
jgi:hypothetical protein